MANVAFMQGQLDNVSSPGVLFLFPCKSLIPDVKCCQRSWRCGVTCCILRVVRQESCVLQQNNLPWDCDPVLLRVVFSQLDCKLQCGEQGKVYFLL